MIEVWIERREECLGEQACVVICGEVFQIGEDGKVVVKGAAGDEFEVCVKEAEESCPVNIIRWRRA
ncbi:MAG: ferredoxin [Acidilobaceae archaeon]|nr:ferredoxin [Acidilobaceae archaeon]